MTPANIQLWNFASKDWLCPAAEIDLRIGGAFSYRMEARDGSMGFDFEGTFTNIQPLELIEFEMSDRRKVEIRFIEDKNGVRVVETFESEDQNSGEQQRQGWQSILDNFKYHVESTDV